jgi:DNA-binding CsgD family transcriptional regulator
MTEPAAILSEKDARSIVSLLADLVATYGDFNHKRRLLMDNLCRLVSADYWLWCMANYRPDEQLGHSGMLHGGFNDASFAGFMEAINHPAMESVSRHSAVELQEKGCHITRSLDQLESPDARLMDSAAGPFWKKAGIGTLMLSLRPMPEGGTSGIGLYRKTGAQGFTQRETLIVHIILSEIPWLHYQHFRDQEKITRLYPRHRTVLNLLCDGWSRKKIATHLGLSENTVHGYAKAIFKHFNVHSHSELMARLSQGDGGNH